MLFSNDDKVSERTLYTAKPNMFLGCKKAIYAFVLLVVVIFVSPILIQFIGEMQVYLISYVKLSLTRYAAIGFFVALLVIVLYIIWQLISWYSIEYVLTESKIIIKSGVLSTKRNYMPYAVVQDINTSQSFIAKIFNVGSISLFSAYDNNIMELSNISNPSEVEEIIFSNMMGYRSFQQSPQRRFDRMRSISDRDDYIGRNEYYDDVDVITPIGHERNVHPRNEYEYYHEDLDYREKSYNRYEYEPYEEEFNRNLRSRQDDNDIYYEGASNSYGDNNYYKEVRQVYSRSGEDYYQNNEPESYYNENSQNKSDNAEENSEKVIKRHFDKFRR